MRFFRRLFSKNDTLYALYSVLSKRKDKLFLKSVIDQTSVVSIETQSGGVDKAPVCVFEYESASGLFWYLRLVLEFFYYCDNMGFVPQLVWRDSLYFDQTIAKTKNPFEYFFENVGIDTQEDLSQRARVVYAPGKTTMARCLLSDGETLYAGGTEYIDALSEIAKKYFRLNQEASLKIQRFIDIYMFYRIDKRIYRRFYLKIVE